uniref:Uncharacterized protein n=1 Tax=Oryza barthii TaxID=65489 RepID=A0A0D3GRL4_9ORYZ
MVAPGWRRAAHRPPRPPSAVGDGGVRLRPSCGDRLDTAALKSLPSGIGNGSVRLRPTGEAEEVTADALALVVDVATDDEVHAAHQFACLVVVDAHHSGPATPPRTSDEKPAARRPHPEPPPMLRPSGAESLGLPLPIRSCARLLLPLPPCHRVRPPTLPCPAAALPFPAAHSPLIAPPSSPLLLLSATLSPSAAPTLFPAASVTPSLPHRPSSLPRSFLASRQSPHPDDDARSRQWRRTARVDTQSIGLLPAPSAAALPPRRSPSPTGRRPAASASYFSPPTPCAGPSQSPGLLGLYYRLFSSFARRLRRFPSISREVGAVVLLLPPPVL